MENKPAPPSHFKGKEAVEHVVEAQTKGLIAKAESHGEEIPGHISAGADAARETAVFFMFLWFFTPAQTHFYPYIVIAVGWLIWKMGRSAWLGWSRLERLHRLVTEEKWEIDHHRQQEREELAALYEAKGFKGKLLEDVLDVLMSDDDRLLRVMLEEELGLSLEKQEHPLKQSLGAGTGVAAAFIAAAAGYFVHAEYGIIAGSLIAVGFAGGLSAYYEGNQKIPAVIWNLGVAVLAWGCAYFLWDYLIR
jgi:vacuolar iron transporter family protein